MHTYIACACALLRSNVRLVVEENKETHIQSETREKPEKNKEGTKRSGTHQWCMGVMCGSTHKELSFLRNAHDAGSVVCGCATGITKGGLECLLMYVRLTHMQERTSPPLLIP